MDANSTDRTTQLSPIGSMDMDSDSDVEPPRVRTKSHGILIAPISSKAPRAAPRIQVRSEPPAGLPPVEAAVPAVREFVHHVLCMSRYEFYRSNPDMIKRVYQIWGGDGYYIRTASQQTLERECESSFAGSALWVEVQRLLLEESTAAEAAPPVEDPPVEGPASRVRKRPAYASAAGMADAGIVGSMHPPDLDLPAMPGGWRSVVDAAYHLATVGVRVGAVYLVYHNWWTIANGSRRVVRRWFR